jgi:elongation factor G
MLEAAAEQDDALTEKFLEGTELTEDEIRGRIRKGCLGLKIVPGVLWLGVQAQGRAAAAGRGGGLPAEPLGSAAGARKSPKGEDETRETSDKAPFSALVFKIRTIRRSSPRTLTFPAHLLG